MDQVPILFVAVLLCAYLDTGSARVTLDTIKINEASLTNAEFSSMIEKQNRQIRNTVALTLIPVIVAFSFIVFIVYRSKRESFFKQKETEFKLNLSELEMKALRAQINPHFIFNCLNSIHHYMLEQDVKLAGDYLLKFSQLIRYVLETSSSRMVTLKDDLDALKIYMQLEQLRMKQSFTYEVVVNGIDDPDALQIPPMIMQPFVENSIWHGLANKGEGGKIAVVLSEENQMLRCMIEDNGVPREAKHALRPASTIKKTSMGMSLIKERLAVVSQIFNVKADFVMENCLHDTPPRDGTRIVLRLPFIE